MIKADTALKGAFGLEIVRALNMGLCLYFCSNICKWAGFKIAVEEVTFSGYLKPLTQDCGYRNVDNVFLVIGAPFML